MADVAGPDLPGFAGLAAGTRARADWSHARLMRGRRAAECAPGTFGAVSAVGRPIGGAWIVGNWRASGSAQPNPQRILANLQLSQTGRPKLLDQRRHELVHRPREGCVIRGTFGSGALGGGGVTVAVSLNHRSAPFGWTGSRHEGAVGTRRGRIWPVQPVVRHLAFFLEEPTSSRA